MLGYGLWFYVFQFTLFGLALFTTVDAAQFPGWAFKNAHVRKSEYVFLPLFVFCFGWVLPLGLGAIGVIYLFGSWTFSRRHRVSTAMRAGPAGFGFPTESWSAPVEGPDPGGPPAAPLPWETRDWSTWDAPDLHGGE